MKFIRLTSLFLLLCFVTTGDGSSAPTIKLVGTAFCDPCFTSEFSSASYFIKGATVKVSCKNNRDELVLERETATNNNGEFEMEVEVPSYIHPTKQCRASLVADKLPKSEECKHPLTGELKDFKLKSKQGKSYTFDAGNFVLRPGNPTISKACAFSSTQQQRPRPTQFPFPFPFPFPGAPPPPVVPVPTPTPTPTVPPFPFPFPFFNPPPPPPPSSVFPIPLPPNPFVPAPQPPPLIPGLPPNPFLPPPPVFPFPPNPFQPPPLIPGLPPNPLLPPPPLIPGLPPNPLLPPPLIPGVPPASTRKEDNNAQPRRSKPNGSP